MLAVVLILAAQALFFFLPAFIADIFPVIFSRVDFFDRFKKPIDGGKKWHGKAIFGDHKTYFGFLVGVTGAVVMGALQFFLYDTVSGARWLFLFNYDFSTAIVLGFLLGFGALLGDLMRSFFKRRLGIASGGVFFPFDLLDFVAGGLLLGSFVYLPSLSHILALVLLTTLLKSCNNFLGYKLGLKKSWW